MSLNQNDTGYDTNNPPVQPPNNPPVNNYGANFGKNPSNIDDKVVALSQPDYNSPYDVIPIPSEGKIYKNKKKNMKVSYMNTTDESILTSPNLLQSGEFLEILMNRKILDSNIRYNDLHVGDRNAIMIWLRATGYGEMYPVTLLDENDIPFDTEINLNNLKIKNLGAEPDTEGLFDYSFPLCKDTIKFKLLSCGDVDEVDGLMEKDKVNNVLVNNEEIYNLERAVIDINGNRDTNFIFDYVRKIRVGDRSDLTKYMNKIESGVDLNIEVGTPGGGSVKTFLPLNVKFFWPNIGI